MVRTEKRIRKLIILNTAINRKYEIREIHSSGEICGTLFEEIFSILVSKVK